MGALSDAWDRYYKSIEEMRQLIIDSPQYKEHPQARAKAYHCLFEAQAMAYNFVMAPRQAQTRIHTNLTWQTDIYSLGQNSPDFHYGCMYLDGRQTYKLHGHFGHVVLNLMQVYNGMPGGEGVTVVGDYDLGEFTRGPDGRFEIIVSATEHKGNWIKLDPNVRYQFVMTRRIVLSPNDDVGEFLLDRVSEIPDGYYDDEEFDENTAAERLKIATDYFRFVAHRWATALYGMYFKNAGNQFNTMTLLPGTTTSNVAAKVSNYAMAVFKIAPDEAAIIELDKAPDGKFWSFQLADVWSRSTNFMSRMGSLNMKQAAIDPDGGLRLVLAHKDPGLHNWLDIVGHTEGMVVLRNFVSQTAPVPKMRKIKFADVAKELPNAQRITPAARAKILEDRRRGYIRRHGE